MKYNLLENIMVQPRKSGPLFLEYKAMIIDYDLSDNSYIVEDSDGNIHSIDESQIN